MATRDKGGDGDGGGGAAGLSLSIVEQVIEKHGHINFESEQQAFRRYDAAEWLRKMVGVVRGKNLPAEPSEDEFRIALRSGTILCSVLNKVQPGAVPKVVEGPRDPLTPNGAALSACSENIRNFLASIQEMGIPPFETFDLEKGGKPEKIVNSVLALKSYNEWKQAGGTGSWTFDGNLRSDYSGKYFLGNDSDIFGTSLNQSLNENNTSLDPFDMTNDSLNSRVRKILSTKQPEQIPMLVESMLHKVMEEFERLLENQEKPMTTAEGNATQTSKVEHLHGNSIHDEELEKEKELMKEVELEKEKELIKEVELEKDKELMKEVELEKDKELKKEVELEKDEELETRTLKKQALFDKQKREVQELRHTLCTTKEGMKFMETQYIEELGSLGRYMKTLAQSTSNYHKVLEENRKLYNQVQDLKGNIRVYCRVRPFLPGETNRLSTVDYIDEGHIRILTSSKSGKGQRSFRFNKVFGPSATQGEVFADTQPLIRSVLDGYNVCIFAYGQTGAGKTHTMTGPKMPTEETLGVNYRALTDLFNLAEQRKGSLSYDISVQMIEIYNEQVRDLLVTDGHTKRLEIRNTSQKGLNVPDANTVPVASTSDVLELMNRGHRNRAVSATALNDRSSRSHSCLTVHVQGKDMSSGAIIRGCMHLVDLAGSERVNKSEATGDRLKEAQHINKSLSALGDVISSLAQKNAHVPYRNSKLTQLLQDSLGGQAKTLMFVHINPESDAIGETLSTLKFAERVATVELGAARPNQEGGAEIKQLREEIASLKAALAEKGESEHVRLSTSSSSETFKLEVDEPMDSVGNLEVTNESEPNPKTPRDALPCPPRLKEEEGEAEKESASSGDWVDKVIVKEDVAEEDRSPSLGGKQERDNKQLPKLFYQRHLSDSAKVFPDQPYNKFVSCKKESPVFDLPRSRSDLASTSTSDWEEAETTASDCSEPELLWQLSLPKVLNGMGSNIKKPLPKVGRSPEKSYSAVLKSSLPTLIPSPSRKLPGHRIPNVPQNGKKKSFNRN